MYPLEGKVSDNNNQFNAYYLITFMLCTKMIILFLYRIRAKRQRFSKHKVQFL
ncbi:TPA_asm: P6 [Wetland metagenome associated alphacytorhabdovirus 1]|nr:TPA_asm: P6 [Wetland metagenome associated alphacytorhabdovirus 1]